jgi:hypothetical protein
MCVVRTFQYRPVHSKYCQRFAGQNSLNPINTNVLRCFLLISESCAPGIEIKCVVVDFTSGFDIYRTIETELQGLDIGVLGTVWNVLYELT